jgi:hypothetical protein
VQLVLFVVGLNVAKKKQEGHCEICGIFCEVICSGYKEGNKPFMDNRNYEEICDCCHAAIKTIEWSNLENTWIVYNPYINTKLYSVEELMKEGWSKEQAKLSIKSIKRVLKCRKKIIKV